MSSAALLALFLGAQAPQAALPEGNAFVRGLLQKQRRREEVLNDYTYDVLFAKEELDKTGAVRERHTQRSETFFVKGRRVRRLVAENDRPLSAKEQAREDKKVQEKVDAILKGNVVTEEAAGVRLSAILERYDFRTLAQEDVSGRSALVLEFSPRPGKRSIQGDHVLRNLAGRIWVDEAEHEVVRAEIRNVGGIKFGFGIGASVSTLQSRIEFHKVDGAVWLPLREETTAAGRILLFKGFRTRYTRTYSRYRRFEVESEEAVRPQD